MANIIEAKSTFMSISTRSIWGVFRTLAFMLGRVFLPGKEKSKQEMRSDEIEFDKTKSPVGFWNLVTRWHIITDLDKRHLIIKKRNWYLIGHQEDIYAFKSVRHVQIKKHVFGADIGIRMFSGTAVAYSISKSKAEQIRSILLNPEWNKMDSDVVIDIEN